MIVITGATGALNGATTDRLLERVPADQVAVAVRDPARAGRFAERGVEVRQADYSRPETLVPAFTGADQLLLVSSNDRTGHTMEQHGNAVAAAVEAGVGRILYTSHQGAAPDNPFPPGRHHAATEQLLADSGLPWTSLRNGFYAHSLAWLAGPWWQTGVIAVPGDGPVSWTAREDSAEAAAVILAADGGYDGPTTITAAAAPTFADIAAMATQIAGRPVRVEPQDEESWVAAQVAQGQPEPVAQMLLTFYQAAQQGFFAGVDPLLGRLLGREPRTARDVLAALPG